MTYLGLEAGAWSALVAALTLVVYVFLLAYAMKQVAEARRSREEQSRPFVIVDFEPGWATFIVVENIGRTAAREVTMSFDPPLSATVAPPWAWEASTAFTSGIPLLPPGRRLRVFFDALTPRFDAGLPMTYNVKLTYKGPPGIRKAFEDQYVLDLNIYRGGSPPEDGLPEIAKHLKDLREVLKSWTHSIDGLRVYNVDAERYEGQRQERRRSRMAEKIAMPFVAPEVPEDVAVPDPPQI